MYNTAAGATSTLGPDYCRCRHAALLTDFELHVYATLQNGAFGLTCSLYDKSRVAGHLGHSSLLYGNVHPIRQVGGWVGGY
jgi:hypothetical protein